MQVCIYRICALWDQGAQGRVEALLNCEMDDAVVVLRVILPRLHSLKAMGRHLRVACELLPGTCSMLPDTDSKSV